jgi:CheY-like chemotaxis protein
MARIARILIIDDEEMVRLSLDMILRTEGWQIELAEGGRDGLARARKNPPDLILCDLKMRGLSGMEILGEIRSDEVLKAVPFLMITADMGVESDQQPLLHGAQAVLLKPFSHIELVHLVEAHLKSGGGTGVQK